MSESSGKPILLVVEDDEGLQRQLKWAYDDYQLIVVGDRGAAIEAVRAINGATDGRKAAPGTIRGDLSLSNRENLVHGSDSEESAAREIALWFPALSR